MIFSLNNALDNTKGMKNECLSLSHEIFSGLLYRRCSKRRHMICTFIVVRFSFGFPACQKSTICATWNFSTKVWNPKIQNWLSRKVSITIISFFILCNTFLEYAKLKGCEFEYLPLLKRFHMLRNLQNIFRAAHKSIGHEHKEHKSKH